MTSRIQWIVVGGALTVLGGLLGAGLAFNSDLRPVGVGSEAPDFTGVNIATGDTVGLDHYRGDVVLLNIWATWCPPCRAEMPSLERLHRDLGTRGLRIVAVSIDHADQKIVSDFVQEVGITFDILHDRKGRVETIYQTTGVPESFVIDRHGVIVKKEIGAIEWDHPSRKVLLEWLLSGDTSASES